MTDVELWTAGGRYVPVVFHSDIYFNKADLFIVEKIVLIDKGYIDHKHIRNIKLIGKKASFVDDGAIVARAGSIVAGSAQTGVPVGFSGKIKVCGYVAENELFRLRTSYGSMVIKNIKTVDYPCANQPNTDLTDCIDYYTNYYTDLLNMSVDVEIDGVDKEYIPWEELERAICTLVLASIKEKLTGVQLADKTNDKP
jgi:hypothetical protein